MLWKLSLKILTPYCQTCKKEDLLWETSTTHSQLPYSKIQRAIDDPYSTDEFG